ncbi:MULTISPECIES: two-component system sensor histidine kinase AtoS [Pelosinus]|uniref:histidine kinase n=1 Tax=Pelosinus fermentans B4 TaxID=1149862 RepID=I9ASC8_9FIRM|nr:MULTISPECIES: two-component system sensor histidine kinase AtoS [Pelosinus]EIW15842.1 PAS sensor protein [Pelosinus fermentans B4]EIW27452.1 signal transduction histidine kinase, nitrogen specific, NtrB [Pelosinus fermentans A11]OAM92591.1 signal transduction histidine kinase, nitrogen specific, NtrB [Pelosinus fermentans DSM 17108]SDQ50114.1 PAS/PAC sensor signal transduction histidine kinase [Pelosinus fermentans]
MRRFFPKTLRYQILLLILMIVSIPILLIGYTVKIQAENALLQEKQIKLFGIARLLDHHLGNGFDTILSERHMLVEKRSDKIKALNERLASYTDIVAAVNAGVGVGYYSKEFDAIITYGPSDTYANKVGISIEELHPGRKVMETGHSMVQFGKLVRGNIMNVMLPIERNGQIVGYIWANELTDDVQAQLKVMDKNIFWSVLIGILVGMMLTVGLTNRFVKDVEEIKRGLQRLRFNLKKPIISMEGEIGEIVDEINHMAQALIDARSLNENIMYSIADGVVTVDTEGMITTMNQAAQQITGFTLEEVIGRRYKEIFRENDQFHSLLLDTLVSGTNHIGIEINYPVKEKYIYISISTSILIDSHNKTIGAVVVFKDLTQQHSLQEQVYRAERLAALGELMASIAHEIRNPLTAIKGFVQYLQNVDSDEERQEYMPIIIKEVDRVNRVIEQLLYFARPYKTHYMWVNINELIESTLVLVQNKTTRHKVEFRLFLADSLPQVEADAEQIRQVLLNLLINAMQAITDKGSVIIDTWQPDPSFVCVRITDTGNGITEENRKKIFDPFFTTKSAGTGLGLAVVQRIISAHYGQVEIESQVNEWTAVTLKLPVVHQGGKHDEA